MSTLVLMTLEEMKQHEWVVSWSGGKDSTATIILMHKYGIPIKYIVYVRMMWDEVLPATLPIMTGFVDEAKAKFEEWGYDVRIVKSLVTAKELSEKVYKRSGDEGRNGNRYGATGFCRGFCNFTDAKTKTIDSIEKNEYNMIGYASDETKRLHRLGGGNQSIMVTLGIKEDETFDICRSEGLLSPLYDLGFSRDGCWFCPNAAKKGRQYIRDNYPELIEKIDHMICMSNYRLDKIYERNNWIKDFFDIRGFVPKYKIEKQEEKQLSLFEKNFNDE